MITSFNSSSTSFGSFLSLNEVIGVWHLIDRQEPVIPFSTNGSLAQPFAVAYHNGIKSVERLNRFPLSFVPFVLP
jgi:hypothetical protein